MATAIKTNEELVTSVVTDLWTEGNLDVIGDLYAEDCIVHEPARGMLTGHDDVGAWVSEIHDAFSDVTVSTGDVLSCEKFVCGTWSMTGKHTGELRPMGIPATGKTVEMTGLFIARTEGGKITEEWNMNDAASMMEQLGLLEQ